jgi:hypothetical protein
MKSGVPLGLFVTISFISCVFAFLGQNTRLILADSTIVPQSVSYSPMDAISSPSGSMARTKKIRMACYPVGGECTKKFRLLHRILQVRQSDSLLRQSVIRISQDLFL